MVSGSAVVGHGDLGNDDQVPVDGDIHVLPVVVEPFDQFRVLKLEAVPALDISGGGSACGVSVTRLALSAIG